jgi:hypothetical protein
LTSAFTLVVRSVAGNESRCPGAESYVGRVVDPHGRFPSGIGHVTIAT